MKPPVSKILLSFSLVLASFLAVSQDLVPLPNPAYVTDQTSTLSKQQQSSLTQKLEAFEKEKGSQVVVVIIPTTGPEEIEQYGIRLAEEWKVGRKNIDDGAILIIAKDDRELRIEVGYGLEGAIPDAYAKRIIETVILPSFRQGQFYEGIDEGTDVLFGLIEGEELPGITNPDSATNTFDLLPVGIFIMFIFISFLKVFVKKKGVKFGIAGGILLLGWLISGVVVGFMLSFVSLFFLFASGSGRSGGGFGGYSSGGGFSGGGFSGGGGFGGGGGGFGGGGASGGW